jgi:hypothetical protein
VNIVSAVTAAPVSGAAGRSPRATGRLWVCPPTGTGVGVPPAATAGAPTRGTAGPREGWPPSVTRAGRPARQPASARGSASTRARSGGRRRFARVTGRRGVGAAQFPGLRPREVAAEACDGP